MAENEMTVHEKEGQYLTFVSDGIHFAIPSDYVIEIINDHTITHLPKMPCYIKGIINLRGQIIPIMDVRLRMNRQAIEIGRDTCTIVIEVGDTTIGLLVDQVSQMIAIDSTLISTAPHQHQQEYVSGITHIGNVVYLMLDCESLLMT